jgi:DNA-binding NarL/FixJ family response regulator
MNSPAKPRSVLIVEDEGLIALDLAVLVEGLGYEVMGPVGSAKDAFALVVERPVDLALVDLNLADGPRGGYARPAADIRSRHRRDLRDR